MTGFRLSNLIVIVAVAAAVTIAAIELARVVTAATEINDSAQKIAASGHGINIATDSVMQLRRTNEIANGILDSARPLDKKLAAIINEAKGIDQVAGSINATAGNINNTAGRINTVAGDINQTAEVINVRAASIDTTAGAILGTARKVNRVAVDIDRTAEAIENTAEGINSEAVQILDIAQEIDRDVRLINTSLDGSIEIARKIEEDTSDILFLARAAHDTAACIDDKLGGPPDGHCFGGPEETGPPGD